MTRRAPARRRFAAAFLAALVLIALGSCRQIAGIEQRGECDEPGGEPGVCEACTRGACCGPLLACRSDSRCAALDGCLADCVPGAAPKCRIDCGKRFPDAQAGAFAALASCRAASCIEACGLGCGGYVHTNPECAACSGKSETCCAQERACVANAACLALALCEKPCPSWDHACRGDCQRLHPAGADDELAFGNCVLEHCAAECDVPLGADWSCLGPDATGGGSTGGGGAGGGDFVSIVVSANALFGSSGEPIEGMSMRACEAIDQPCDNPVWQGTTEDGSVTALLPLGFDGYLRGEGGMSVPSGIATMAVILYLPEPVGEASTFDFGVFPFEIYDAVYGHVAAPDHGTKGHVYAEVFDCSVDGTGHSNRRAGGVTFQLEPGDPKGSASPYYGGVGDWPFDSTSGTGPNTGKGGFVNVTPSSVLPPQSYLFRAIRRDNEECVDAQPIFVEAGKETQLVMKPGLCP